MIKSNQDTNHIIQLVVLKYCDMDIVQGRDVT